MTSAPQPRALPPTTDVLVVGGGLTGLASAALLGLHGVRVLLVERRPSTSHHPKARLVNARTMEIFRALGIEGQVLAAGEPNGGFTVADTLAAEHETWIPAPAEDDTADLSPSPAWSCDQQRIEPLVRDRAHELGADVRFAHTAHIQSQDADGINAVIEGHTVRARYLIAADGAHSPSRTALNIDWSGESLPGAAVSALFHAHLEPALRGRHTEALFARSAGAFLFARGNASGRSWQLGTHVSDSDPDDLDQHVRDTIRIATGIPDLQPVIDDIATWRTGAYVATRLRAGRAFLVGDAAHVMPPYGGFGGNTGVQDAHALAWRLAFACRGDDTWLDSYETERLPVARRTVSQALLRSRKTPGTPPPPEQIDATTLVLGFHYGTGGVEDPAIPSGEPGTRAAHIRLRDGRSSLDLFDPTAFTTLEVPADIVTSEDLSRRERVYRHGVTIRPDGVLAAHPSAAPSTSVCSNRGTDVTSDSPQVSGPVSSVDVRRAPPV